MTIDEMKEIKKKQGFSNKMISDLSGVPFGTVQKIFGGETSSPRYDTIQALQRFFEEATGGFSVQSDNDVVKEGAAYKASRDKDNSEKNNKNIDDYLALPEGTRIEMIDGVFYDMASPTTKHQEITGELYVELKMHVRKNKGSCHPYVSPIDVQLNSDDKTIVQPDVIVVCDKNKITTPRIVGAPDFIAEVLSPSNVFMDTTIKLGKYEKAGVREYWIISSEMEKVVVYFFEKNNEPVIYSFDDDIPVGIWNGECTINFRKLLNY